MRVEQEKVEMFHDKYGYPCPEKPEILKPEDAEFRAGLILEELHEYICANADGNLVGVADGLADLLYVVIGTAVYHGINLQPIFEEVHRSNMTKELSRDNLNKPVKGDTFEGPRIAELLLLQSTGL